MFRHRTVWHSALREACERAGNGRLRITFGSPVVEPENSRWGPYVEFRADGDDQVRRYIVESPRIRALIESIPQGRPVQIQAGGGRQNQILRAWTDAGEEIPQPEVAETPKTDRRRPERRRQGETTGAATTEAAATSARDTIAAEAWVALLESTRMVSRFKRRFRREPTLAEIQLAAAIHAQMDGRREVSRQAPTDAELGIEKAT